MPTNITDPRAFFLHELGDALTFERTIAKLLPKFEQSATDKKLSQGFKKHFQQTKKHVTNVEKAFKALGKRPKAERCPGIEGIKAEFEQFAKTKPAPKVFDTFLMGAAARTEHYEIATYEGLVTMAKGLGENEAAKFLQQNLKEDKATLKEFSSFWKHFVDQFGSWQNGGVARTTTGTVSGRKTATGRKKTTTRGTTRTTARKSGTKPTARKTGTKPTARKSGTKTTAKAKAGTKVTARKTRKPTTRAGGTTSSRRATTRPSGSTRRKTTGTSRRTTSSRRTSASRTRARARA